ncbi:lipocalin family protein [Hymenobacter sp. BT730]|uniref:lipocalin family protein n=1 Tax=Hymenobacter sp. BT730 TaxID=3063332 RepID=UPI0026DF7C07|nr:lipocalin family protein [Hymenobacter sp. BT730]
MKTNLKFIAAALLLAVTACDKDKDSSPSPSVTENQLVEKNWQMSAMTISPALESEVGPISDLYAWMPSCSKDDFIRFEKNGSFRGDEGGSKCDEEDPQTTSTGTWTLTDGNKKLTTVENGESQTFTVDNLSKEELKLSLQETEEGVTYTVVTTFRKK